MGTSLVLIHASTPLKQAPLSDVGFRLKPEALTLLHSQPYLALAHALVSHHALRGPMVHTTETVT